MPGAAEDYTDVAAVRALQALEVLDTPAEPEFDALAGAAALACDASIALISLLDTDRQWFKAAIGLPGVRQTPRRVAFCAHAVETDGVFEVPDARHDPRFADNPLVTGHPHVRFYAGAPIRLSGGERIGTVCVIDREPRQGLEDAEREILLRLATAASAALEGRLAVREVREAESLAAGVVAELAAKHELLHVTWRAVGDAVVATDAHGAVTWLNPVAEALTGWTQAEAAGRPLEEVVQLRQAPDASSLLRSREGIDHRIEASVSPVRSHAGVDAGSVLVLRDITAQSRLAAEMNFRATHDPLTGLVNRAEFEAQLDEVLRLARIDDSMHSLLFVDLDDFKLVNDAGGHTVGDRALQEVAQLLSGFVRTTDTLARLGGDDFAIILRHCTAAQAEKVAEKICALMHTFRFDHGERKFRIGTSIGLVPVDRRWDAIGTVIQAADSACRAASEQGGNRVHTWFEADAAIHARQGEMQWATRLEQALDDDRFVLFAQRITPLRDSTEGIHAEVLLRMVARDGKLVPPGLFLPAAERFHLAQRIDRWVLGHAIEWLSACPSRHLIDTLSVNLSGRSVGDRAFHGWAIDALRAAGPELCGRLCLEITETAAVTNMADATAFVQLVREAGVRVALDDFGAGAASFGYLKALPVDYLKIDGQFVRTLLTDPLDAAAVRCFVDVARVLGVKTVAEFVDQPAVLARLGEIGVDFAQGFLLHKPAPIDELLGAFGGLPRSVGERRADLSALLHNREAAPQIV